MKSRGIPDIGCSDGSVSQGFTQWGALPDNPYGVDLRPESIEVAKPSPELRLSIAARPLFR